jgi:hypothetical protein
MKKPRKVDQPYEALFGDLKVLSPLGATRQPVLGDHSFAGTGRTIKACRTLKGPVKNPRSVSGKVADTPIPACFRHSMAPHCPKSFLS